MGMSAADVGSKPSNDNRVSTKALIKTAHQIRSLRKKHTQQRRAGGGDGGNHTYARESGVTRLGDSQVWLDCNCLASPPKVCFQRDSDLKNESA